jgi:GT2 family glycosyltransferase
MIDVSIIIVSWNAKQYLLDCLNSIVDTADECSQEIIVVDNASSDGSPDAVASLFPEVTLIRNKENLGFARANNIAIRTSSGRYVCLINSDVVVLDGCIEGLVKCMDSNPTVGMAGPRILNQDRSLQVTCRHFPSIWNNLCQAIGLNKVFPRYGFFSEPLMRYCAHDSVRSVDVLSGCFWMVRREALDEVGLLDERFFFYGEDIDWCRRFHKAEWDILFYSETEAIHFGGASSDNSPIRFYLEMQKADLQYWRKHHGRTGQAGYAMIIVFRHLLRVPFSALQYILSPKGKELALFKLRRNLACIRWVLFNRHNTT